MKKNVSKEMIFNKFYDQDQHQSLYYRKEMRKWEF